MKDKKTQVYFSFSPFLPLPFLSFFPFFVKHFKKEQLYHIIPENYVLLIVVFSSSH